MEFLLEVGFSDENIKLLNNNLPSTLYNLIIDNRKLIIQNIKYLKDAGIEQYEEIFKRFYELFLMDHSAFVGKFDSYEKEDLIAHIKKDINVVEFL